MKHTKYPAVLSRWKYKIGMEYTVICVTNTAVSRGNHEPQVVYQGDNGNIWSRPLSDWYVNFEPKKQETK